MWILPKNYPLSSHYVADMVESKEDLTLPGLNIESSLLVKSKPSQLRTWLTRWKPTSFHPHLFIRILKPCQWNAFETELTSSLAVTHASHFRQQDSEKEQMIPDTSGLTSKKSSEQLDLLDASLKTSKDTLALDCEKSLATWKASVTKQRGEYSQRVKSAHRTKEKESTSWPTPRANKTTAENPETWLNRQAAGSVATPPLALAAQMGTPDFRQWPTPRASEYKDCGPVGSKSHTHMDKKSYLCAKAKDHDMPLGMLNPDWVEWLMGVPTGWTALGCWETE